jgi:hypothetical protein
VKIGEDESEISCNLQIGGCGGEGKGNGGGGGGGSGKSAG